MKYHALFVIFDKRQNLKLSSAANYRWRSLRVKLTMNISDSGYNLGVQGQGKNTP